MTGTVATASASPSAIRGLPGSQISAATGGAWPWAFGPPLFLPPPVPPISPLTLGLFNGGLGNNVRLSAQAVIPGRLSAQAIGGAGLGGLGVGGMGTFGIGGGLNGFGFGMGFR